MIILCIVSILVCLPVDGMLPPGDVSGNESDVPGSESDDASSVPNNLHDNEVIPTLYVSRDEIEKNSPSRRDGIDLKLENRLRISYCTFLTHLGEKLKTSQATIDTAIVLCHRFFLGQSHAKNDRRTIATACMILAGKVDEVPQALEDVIVASYEIMHKKELDASQRKEVCEQQKEIVLSGEKLVLSTLNFDLMVYLPYKHLLEAIKKYIVEEDKTKFTQVAWTLLNDSFRTTLCLQYEPHHIASGVFFHTTDLLGTDLQSHGEGMCQEFNTTSCQIKDIIGQIRELYVEKPVPGREAERSNGGDMVDQPVSRDMASTDDCSSSDIEGGSATVNLSQSDDHSICDMSRPEGIAKDNAESEAEENRDDHSVPNMTDEASDGDVGVSRLEKDLQIPPEEEVKANAEKDEKPSDKGIEKRDLNDENDLREREVEDVEEVEIVDANQSGVEGELMADDPLMNDNDLEEMDHEDGDVEMVTVKIV
ncbi:unnamed protein product [Microthlaspi erraticum]|uniref:Cyclin-like domain-containing protein n=1 Tax=Microthlaspi erraticum TaxID=1685480 RepID=A0A6D2KS25_9BRAS|nr:unnamed protein product [Microthlaspi erraticum]